MTNSYFNPVRIRMGRGMLIQLSELLGKRKAVLVTTQGMLRRGQATIIQEQCVSNIIGMTAGVISNPTIASINKCFGELAHYDFDVLIALGGGSAIDTAKGVAVLAGGAVSPDWLNLFFRHGDEKPEVLSSKPIIAIPTTSGTGSEVTMWATVWDELSGDKYSISDERLYPEWALLDPALTDSLPYEPTLYSVLDAFSHAMESIWNRNSNPVSDALAVKAISSIIAVLRNKFRQKYKLQEVREILQNASLLAGLAFSNTKTALAHSISYPLTSKLGIPHGLACSFTLPEVLRINYSQNNIRTGIVLHALGCSSLDEATALLYELFSDLSMSGYIRQFVSNVSDVFELDANFASPGRFENNLFPASYNDIEKILRVSMAHMAID